MISIRTLEKVLIAMADFQGKMIYYNELSMSDDTAYEVVIKALSEEIMVVLKATKISPDRLCGIAIGCDGIIDSKEGVLLNPTNHHWDNHLTIRRDLENALPFKTKIIIDSTYRFSGYAELLFEENLKGNIFVLTWDDTRVFGGCMLSNRVFMEGNTDIVGEFPHIIIDTTSPIVCSCGRCGCIGSVLSKEAVFEYISRIWEKYPESLITEKYKKGSLIAKDIFLEGKKGDPFACDLLDHIIDYYAILIHNVLSLHSAQRVILQGLFAESGDYFISNLKQKLYHFNNFDIHKDVDIIYSIDSDNSPDYLNNKFLNGAALYAFNQCIRNASF